MYIFIEPSILLFICVCKFVLVCYYYQGISDLYHSLDCDGDGGLSKAELGKGLLAKFLHTWRAHRMNISLNALVGGAAAQTGRQIRFCWLGPIWNA